MRNLYIHAGLPKTGTSAFQTFCGQNEVFLRDQLKLSYPDYCGSIEASAKGITTSGNGLAIAAAINSPIPSAPKMIDQGQHQINELLNDDKGLFFDNILLSSEWFSAVSPEDFEKFSEKCEQNNLKLHLLFVVRDIAPWVYSLYGEAVKGGYCSTSFNEYFDEDKLDQIDNIINLSAISKTNHKFSIKILNYADIKKSIGKSILEEITGKGLQKHWPSEENSEPVNRSLTSVELEIVRTANELLPSEYGRSISKALTAQDLRQTKNSIAPNATREVCAKASAIIERINPLIFGSPIKFGDIEISGHMATSDSIGDLSYALNRLTTAFFSAINYHQSQIDIDSADNVSSNQSRYSCETSNGQDDGINLVKLSLWQSVKIMLGSIFK